ncbi:MAG: ribulose-phosphate 3-epimerase [Bacteroidales bacterium]|nr:ribulose-phosphate 3-epimerase [Bacteroidales bacterium]MBD5294674.1 ribulose-phosphate 3-epimerase [Bacteroides sp.]MBD5341751.1 ribulose-phosphate 3-epimerase [Bacteroides sp.]MBD5352430.1 ribulose-phosphate 3-epimerase [Bacteroides sp.]MBD5359218.1 ribulose-phosphate 3-epimerase [Bacteroides sp.]
MTQIAPSMLSANFGSLDADVEMVNNSDAAMIHLDVMDGQFVPNISFGFPVIEAIARKARKPLDAHLMILEPDKWVDTLARLGVETMNVHWEACTHLHRTVQAIRAAGMKPAVTLNPATPVEFLRDIITDVDMVLLMSVNPGFGGQKFIPQILDKTRRLRRMISESGSQALIQIDGGVNMETGRQLVEAGADILVAGSYVFNSPNPAETIANLARL